MKRTVRAEGLTDVLYAHLWEGSSYPADEAECCAEVVIDFLTALCEREDIQQECANVLSDDDPLEARAAIRQFIKAAAGPR